jgi:hypothetical protein
MSVLKVKCNILNLKIQLTGSNLFMGTRQEREKFIEKMEVITYRESSGLVTFG